MFRKNYFTCFFTIVLLLTGSAIAFAQTAPVRGKVELQKEDGTKSPVAGALVEIFRTDIKAKGPTAKTNAKGEFSFAGIQLAAVYVISVSAPNAKPSFYPNVRAGAEGLVITMTPGDGKQLTEAEVRTALASDVAPLNTSGNTKTEPTADQKKAAEELAKQRAEIEEKNKKIENQNVVFQNAMKVGNEAFTAKNYDAAIAEYEKGYQANTTYVGSAPGFLNNKGTALSNRGVELYNQAIKMTDATAKGQAFAKVTKDFGDAIDSYNTAWTILKGAQPAEITNQQNYEANKKQGLEGARSVIRYMIQTEKVDPAKVPAIMTILPEYLAFETDATKKAEAEVFLADIYRISGDSTNAIAEYKKVLEKNPTNPDALAGLGLSQANAGYNADGSINDAMMQEAINNLQKFADTAPANHKLKESVKQTVDYLKTQNFKPQKTAPAKGGKKKG